MEDGLEQLMIDIAALTGGKVYVETADAGAKVRVGIVRHPAPAFNTEHLGAELPNDEYVSATDYLRAERKRLAEERQQIWNRVLGAGAG